MPDPLPKAAPSFNEAAQITPLPRMTTNKQTLNPIRFMPVHIARAKMHSSCSKALKDAAKTRHATQCHRVRLWGRVAPYL